MKLTKQVVSATLALALAATLTVSANAHAIPGYGETAPASSIELCVAQISEKANYENAGRVRHNVSSRQRRVSGHTISVDTTVFGPDGHEVIREYTTVCVITDNKQTRHFAIKEKGAR